MKKQLFFVGTLALLFANPLLAQDLVSKKNIDGNGRVDLITFASGLSSKSANTSDILKQSLNLDAKATLKSIKVEDGTGKLSTDEKFQLFYDGIKVQYAVYTLHSEMGKMKSLSGNIFSINDVQTSPSLSKLIAFNSALKYTNAKSYMWENADYVKESKYEKPEGELVLLPVEQHDGSYKLLLAYKFDIYAAQPLSRENVFIDANDGSVLMTDSILKHENEYYSKSEAKNSKPEINKESLLKANLLVNGNAATKYSGTQVISTTLVGSAYTLRDSSRGSGIFTYNLKKGTVLKTTDFTDADNNWTAAEFNNAAFDNAALDAHWGVTNTYDYFKTNFNRNSYDNAGAALKSYVHYSSAYENAYWSGSEMIYGDGASTFSTLTSLDVTAHELGHAVCQATANLVYSRESGAINEGLSDIWGAVVENAYAPAKQNFLIGEDITKVSPGYLRSMSDPNSGYSKQPDTYKGTYWQAATSTCSPTNNNDQCGVHTNSGVLNHFFYILTQGKIGTNDLGNAFNVTGIGFVNSAKIIYRMETAYLSATSTYDNVKTYAIQSAKDLFGADSPEAIATQNALYAVGLGTAYTTSTADTVAPSAPSNLAATGTTSTATNLSWTASTDNVAVSSYDVYRNSVLLGNTATTSTSVTGLTASTAYTFYVKAKDAAGNVSANSNTISVTTLAGTAVAYCASQGNSTADEKIGKVTFGTINNTSTGTSGYENYTTLWTDATKGSAYAITITPKWTSTTYNEAYAVFIDYNQDGDFSDAGETVFTKAASKTTPVSASITIPSTALTGNTRMRVSMKYNAVPTACEAFSYGQVEDYTINIKAVGTVSSLVGLTTESAVSIYPNPVKDVLNVNIKGDYTYQIFSANGQSVLAGNATDKTVNVAKLPVGLYILKITQGGKTSSHKLIKK
ncbi:M4 family metallopeptidase [Halpernia frigidisoli]|uniref:Por secretion system C-terminal sorting domain-containing protein n=1 Tax=Halpernia frigidisoli TaxID=1125876 RepID=A0A1I3DJG7_9FLAO|nr:M4 family metallopeptidase [Halpernia frigidisoli]SFH86729.1 Por secretion system C-terminal sorting domain-containing protein [Halpernia frigidisoli]